MTGITQSGEKLCGLSSESFRLANEDQGGGARELAGELLLEDEAFELSAVPRAVGVDPAVAAGQGRARLGESSAGAKASNG